MRIYNEVIIDMNPESSSYGETLHEDSFEYSGDVALCAGEWKKAYFGPIYDSEGHAHRMDARVVPYKKGAGVKAESEQKIVRNMKYFVDDDKRERWSTNRTHRDAELEWMSAKGDYFPDEVRNESPPDVTVGDTTFETYADEGGETQIDMDKDAFKEYILGGGSMEDLGTAFGAGEGDFDAFDTSGIDFAQRQYDITTGGAQDTYGIAESRADIAQRKLGFGRAVGAAAWKGAQGAFTDAIQQQFMEKREAEQGYTGAIERAGMGSAQAGLQAGRSLFDIKGQADVAATRSGFAGGGGGAAAGRAQRGVMADYQLQQRGLAADRLSAGQARTSALGRAELGMSAAERGVDLARATYVAGEKNYLADMESSALDLSSAELTMNSALAQAGLTQDISVDDVWDTAYEDFYATLDTIEGMEDDEGD